MKRGWRGEGEAGDGGGWRMKEEKNREGLKDRWECNEEKEEEEE